jgi:hypothetical protein
VTISVQNRTSKITLKAHKNSNDLKNLLKAFKSQNIDERQSKRRSVSPSTAMTALENIGFVCPTMSMIVIGHSLLY